MLRNAGDEVHRPEGHASGNHLLTDVVVLDLTAGATRYCGRLLAHLGAAVTGHLALSGPEAALDAGRLRLGRTPSTFDSAAGRKMLASVDVLITDKGPEALRAVGLHPDRLRGMTELIHVSISPYGLTGPWADRPASDLTVQAAGGLLYLGGDSDREPVRAYGDQSAIAACLHAATATLMALYVRDMGLGGQLVDVSVQEAVAHSTENAVQYYDCERVIRHRAGAGATDAGSGLFRCRDGWVYLLTSMGGVQLGWARLVDWLVEEGVANAALLESEPWADAEYRRGDSAKALFAEIFEQFAHTRTKLALYLDGQKRGVSLAPVSDPGDLLANEQLRARDFFTPFALGENEILLPGPPFRIWPSVVPEGAR